MRFHGGYLEVARVAGVPIRIHWTAPLGALLLGRFHFVPVFWACFFVLILIHELGHWLMVKLAHARVLAVELSGVGGACRWEGWVAPIDRAIIAWGGVWAQALVLALAVGLWLGFGPPTTSAWEQASDVFIQANIFLMLFNLLPIPPLDGREAWSLIPIVRSRMRRKREQRHLVKIQESAVEELRKLERLEGEDAFAEEAHELLERLTVEIQSTRSKKTEKP